MRAVALGNTLRSGDGPIRSAVERALPCLDVIPLQTRRAGSALTLLRLLKLRPRLVIAEASAREATSAALYRILTPSSRLLLCLTGSALPRGRIGRLALARADEVVERPDDVPGMLERLRAPLPAALAQLRPAPTDLDLFAAIPATRDVATSYRFLHVGPLSPESGAADLLVALAGWAEQHPDRQVEICWAGEGDLAGVFEAQPLPSNLSQQFVGELDRRALAEVFAATGIMVVPLAGPKAPVLEALAAGLVLIGERRSPAMRQVVRAGAQIWTFDAWGKPDLAAALAGALEASAAALDSMRDAGRVLARGTRVPDAPNAESPTALARPARLVSDEVFP